MEVLWIFCEQSMPVTLTIKNVPDDLADRLRERAADHRRSLQRELLLILEVTAASGDVGESAGGGRATEPTRAVYRVSPDEFSDARTERRSGPRSKAAAPTGKLTLDELWRHARKLGAPSPAESADLIRRDRDARDGH